MPLLTMAALMFTSRHAAGREITAKAVLPGEGAAGIAPRQKVRERAPRVTAAWRLLPIAQPAGLAVFRRVNSLEAQFPVIQPDGIAIDGCRRTDQIAPLHVAQRSRAEREQQQHPHDDGGGLPAHSVPDFPSRTRRLRGIVQIQSKPR